MLLNCDGIQKPNTFDSETVRAGTARQTKTYWWLVTPLGISLMAMRYLEKSYVMTHSIQIYVQLVYTCMANPWVYTNLPASDLCVATSWSAVKASTVCKLHFILLHKEK